MNPRLPSTRITPEDVLAYCTKRGQKPTLEEARIWLAKQRTVIQEMMGKVIQDNLDEILDEACLHAYPEPAFHKQWKLIDHALLEGAERYAEKLGLENLGSSHTETEMVQVVRRMMNEPELFQACLAYTAELGPHIKNYEDMKITHLTHRAHVISAKGHVTAELVACDGSGHDHDYFVPEKLRTMN